MDTTIKPCRAEGVKKNYSFPSKTHAASWIIENGLSSFKKNTISRKISEAIRNKTEYCGLKWFEDSSKKLEVFDYNEEREEWHPHIKQSNAPKISILSQSTEDINNKIKEDRKQVYADSLGIKAGIYKNIPTYITPETVKKDVEYEYNIMVMTEQGWIIVEDISQLAKETKTNIGRKELETILFDRVINNYPVKINDSYLDVLYTYLGKFER